MRNFLIALKVKQGIQLEISEYAETLADFTNFLTSDLLFGNYVIELFIGYMP